MGMGVFDIPKDEVFIYADGEKKMVAIIDGKPFDSEVKKWVFELGTPEKITVAPFDGGEYTVYENGKIMNCRTDFM